MNLCSNAVKFTDRGEVFIETKIVSQNSNTIEIEFSVNDTGIGISKEVEKNLFQPFIQGESGYNKKYQGTGLGLAISKRFTELMGGTIGFERKDSFGSRFYFRIPVKKSGKYIHRIDEIEYDYKKIDILFIDDNAL